MLILKRNMTQQTFHLHHPRLLGHVLVFCCIWRMMFHKLNMSFDIWPPTVQSPLKRVSQCFDIWRDIFAATWTLRVFEMGWSSNWHFPWLSERGSKWTCFGGVHWLWLGFRPCQQKVCKLLHCDVWEVLDILSIKDSEDHFVVISWSRSLRLQQWSQWRHPTCQVVDMDHQQKNPYLHLHWQQWCQRNLESKGSWTFETLELPHLVVAGYGWKWKSEVMQHQRPFESRWHRNKTFSCPENEIFDEFAWFVQQIKWMFGRSRWSRTSFCSKGQPQSPCWRLEPDPTSFTRMWFNFGRWL